MYHLRHTASIRTRGSSLVAVMIFVTVMSAAVAGVLSYTAYTHRNSVRQSAYEQARLVAESEMEYLFNGWIQEARAGYVGQALCDHLASDGYIITAADPFADGIKAQGLRMAPIVAPATTGGWRITRIISFPGLPGRTDGGASGQVPGTQKLGHNFYYEAQIRALINHPIFGVMEYKAARRFVQTETSLFQNAIYYQDDLEIAAAGVLTVNGDISCSGDNGAYLSAQLAAGPANDLVIYGTARIFGTLNGATIDGTGAIGAVKRIPGSLGSNTSNSYPLMHDPIFDPSGGVSVPTDQVATRAIQVQKLVTKENVLGGVDVGTALINYPDAYRNDPTLAGPSTNPSNYADSNQVYRSVIAPPQVDTTSVAVPKPFVPEDPIIYSRRMYNRAGLIITIDMAASPILSVGTYSLDPAHSGVTWYNTAAGVLSDMNAIVPPAERHIAVGDQREHSDVYMTNFYVDQLIAKIATNSALSAAFNGVIYIHDATDNGGGVNIKGNAIRIKNATATPVILDSVTHQPKGFTIVSNNGVYVQGNFNTTATSAGHYNPCVIMGDAITVLSTGFVDHTYATSPTVLSRVASANITINSALISGFTPSATGTSSGGVQNLIRYLEDWSAHSATFHGSLSELFVSKYFNGVFVPNGAPGNVYMNPSPRTFDFDLDLADTPPALSPKSSNYFRGDFYTW